MENLNVVNAKLTNFIPGAKLELKTGLVKIKNVTIGLDANTIFSVYVSYTFNPKDGSGEIEYTNTVEDFIEIINDYSDSV